MTLKRVIWLGNSKSIIAGFPLAMREDLGHSLFELQQGRQPRGSRPMKSLGAGVFELKESDSAGWYRVIYTLKIYDRIYVLHCFKKKSRKTAQADLELTKRRLGLLNMNLNRGSE